MNRNPIHPIRIPIHTPSDLGFRVIRITIHPIRITIHESLFCPTIRDLGFSFFAIRFTIHPIRILNPDSDYDSSDSDYDSHHPLTWGYIKRSS